MSGMEVVGLLFASIDAAVNALTAIKRSFDAYDDISRLIRRCHGKLRSIHRITNQLDTRTCRSQLIDVVLRDRLNELEDVTHELSKLKRKTARASPITCVWKSQDYARSLQRIADDLDKLQSDIANVGMHNELRDGAKSLGEQNIACVDATVQKPQNSKRATALSRRESRLLLRVELSARDMKLLARYGKLYELPLPDSLYEAWRTLRSKSAEWAKRKGIQFLRFSAGFLHERANRELGLRHKWGFEVEQDDNLAISYYLASGPYGNEYAARVYFKAGEHKQARNQLRLALARNGQVTAFCLVPFVLKCWFGSDGIDRSVEDANKYSSLIRNQPFVQSVCLFWGIGTTPDREKALSAYEKHYSRRLDCTAIAEERNVAMLTIWGRISGEDRYNIIDVLRLACGRRPSDAVKSYFDFLISKGHVREIQNLAALLYGCGDVRGAKQYVQRGARRGFIECQIWLHGYYKHQNRTKRAEYYLRSAVRARNVSKYIGDARFNSNAERARLLYIKLYDSKRAVSRAVKDVPGDEGLENHEKFKARRKRK